jgi:hypothetical protein
MLPTVQAILASRIDRLAAAVKELLQTLAVLGREFPLSLIKRVTAKSDDELEPMLSRSRSPGLKSQTSIRLSRSLRTGAGGLRPKPKRQRQSAN